MCPPSPEDRDVSICTQTSLCPATCSADLEDVLIMLCDSQDSQTVRKNNSDELCWKENLTIYSPAPWKSRESGVWPKVGVAEGSDVLLYLYVILLKDRSATLIVHCNYSGKTWWMMICPCNWWGFLFIPSLLSHYCHGNKLLLEVHLHATFARTPHEVNLLLFPSQHLLSFSFIPLHCQFISLIFHFLRQKVQVRVLS